MSRADLSHAVEHALRAPSVHNTQPWRWRIGSDTVELYADWDRHLIATDPDRRDLLLSCGAALHHLVVALAAGGLAVDVRRLPDDEDRGHLATVRVVPGPADPVDAALAPAISGRRTDRRPMSPAAVSAGVQRALARQAARNGARLVPVTDDAQRLRLLDTLADAAVLQHDVAGYPAELAQWTHRSTGGHDGIPATSVATGTRAHGIAPLRRFPISALHSAPRSAGYGDAPDGAVLLVVTTVDDDPASRLRAGEATSAVLLAATRLGLATTPLSQAIEVADSRHRLQEQVLHVPEFAQLVVRVGRPMPGTPDLPPTPRRALSTVLAANESAWTPRSSAGGHDGQ